MSELKHMLVLSSSQFDPNLADRRQFRRPLCGWAKDFGSRTPCIC